MRYTPMNQFIKDMERRLGRDLPLSMKEEYLNMEKDYYEKGKQEGFNIATKEAQEAIDKYYRL